MSVAMFSGPYITAKQARKLRTLIFAARVWSERWAVALSATLAPENLNEINNELTKASRKLDQFITSLERV